MVGNCGSENQNGGSMVRRNKKGSLIVEATIFLPIFIVGIVTLTYIIKILWFQESVFRVFADEARKVSAEAYLSESDIAVAAGELGLTEIANKGLFNLRIKSALKEEGLSGISTITVRDFNYLYSAKEMDGLISISLTCDVKPALPIGSVKEIQIQNALIFRGWIGEISDAAPLGFERMKTDEASRPVYIFPNSGKKYHSFTCSYVSVYPVKMMLSKSVKKSYDPCKLCNSATMLPGETVYCFSVAGKVYHRSECSAVDKYTEKIEMADAVAKGYTPCSKCGGGN